MVDFGPNYSGNYGLGMAVWVIQQDIAGNRSLIGSAAFLHSRNSYWFNGHDSRTVQSIGGVVTRDGWGRVTLPANGVVEVARTQRWVGHAANGTLRVGSITDFQNSIVGSLSVAGDINAPTIPRATDPSIPSSGFTTGNSTTIGLPRAASGFTHVVSWRVGSQSGTISSNAGTSVAWTPPHSVLTEIPNSTAGSVEITAVTKSGSSTIGTKKVTRPLNANSSVRPTIDFASWADANTDVSTKVGEFVRNISRLVPTVQSSGAYGSRVVSQGVRLSGTLIPSGSTVIPAVAGQITSQAEIIDSRGRTNTQDLGVLILDYDLPTAEQYEVYRTGSNSAPQDNGKYLTIRLKGSISSLVTGGSEKNSMTILVETRSSGGAWISRNSVQAGLSVDQTLLVSGGGIFSDTQSYEVRTTLIDSVGGRYVMETTVATGTVTLDLSGVNVGVGKMWERGGLDVAGAAHAEEFYADNTPILPIGGVLEWYTPDTPTGYLRLEGQAVSRTTYSKLYELWGDTFGAGDGTTTFDIPDRRGRAGVGVNPGDTEFKDPGAKFGTKTHTLTVSQIPKHRHSVYTGYGDMASGATDILRRQGWATTGRQYSDNFSGQPILSDTGGGGAHNNIQPSIAAYYIVRAL